MRARLSLERPLIYEELRRRERGRRRTAVHEECSCQSKGVRFSRETPAEAARETGCKLVRTGVGQCLPVHIWTPRNRAGRIPELWLTCSSWAAAVAAA